MLAPGNEIHSHWPSFGLRRGFRFIGAHQLAAISNVAAGIVAQIIDSAESMPEYPWHQLVTLCQSGNHRSSGFGCLLFRHCLPNHLLKHNAFLGIF